MEFRKCTFERVFGIMMIFHSYNLPITFIQMIKWQRFDAVPRIECKIDIFRSHVINYRKYIMVEKRIIS